MDIVTRLLKTGYTKYRIAKQLGVHWNTVHRWANGTHPPTPSHQIKLKALLKVRPASFPGREAR